MCQTRLTICSREEEQDIESANAEVTPVCDKRSDEIIRALDEELLDERGTVPYKTDDRWTILCMNVYVFESRSSSTKSRVQCVYR